MNNKISIELRGSGIRVSAYVIDSKILKKIKEANEKDALYEDNPISVVRNLAKRAFQIAGGFCIYSADDLTCKVKINNKKTVIKKIGLLYDGCDYKEEFSTPRNKTLIAREENSEPLGEKENIGKNEILVVEVEEMKLAQMSANFEVDQPISVSELEIGLVDLDVDTELSRAVYPNGILQGMEKDIKWIIYDNTKHEFECEILSGYSSTFYLVRRNSRGEWVSEYF